MRTARREKIRAALSALLAAILLLSAGCGLSPTPETGPAPTEPAPHEHVWDGGVCAVCGAECVHHWRVGVCTVCGLRCAHEWRDGICRICTLRCEHDWQDGVCAICGKICEHRWRDGVCIWCGLRCEHDWQDGVCAICGLGCEHDWQEGVCGVCGLVCPHGSHDAQSRVCALCGLVVPHEYLNGVCTLCGEGPVFVTRLKDFPPEAVAPTEEHGTLECFHFPLEEGEILPGARGTKTREERRMRDMVIYTPFGYDPEKQYNVLILAPGAGHSAHQWMEKANRLSGELGRFKGCDLLDSWIAGGWIEPLIVVEVEYYLKGTPAEIALTYGRDLRERVLPFLAENYGTYASVNENGELIPAPEHFAVEGCSYGAMILWQMLPDNMDLYAYWGMLSGGYRNEGEAELIERIDAGGSGEHPIHYLYAGDGKLARGWSAYMHRIERLDRDCSCLRSGVNLSFLAVEKTTHNYSAWDTGLFNSLQMFFRSRCDASLLPPEEPAPAAKK